jgi:hypothetical protein
MKNEIRKDDLTGEEFNVKRCTQRFAKPANRIKYHNEQAALVRAERKDHDLAIGRNLKIIKELLNNKAEARFSKEFLRGKGFSFANFSNMALYGGVHIFAVYGYLWMNELDAKGVPNGFIKLIKP